MVIISWLCNSALYSYSNVFYLHEESNKETSCLSRSPQRDHSVDTLPQKQMGDVFTAS